VGSISNCAALSIPILEVHVLLPKSEKTSAFEIIQYSVATLIFH
jgi:hypothetical protein